jgi:hypothetical protein
MENLKEDRQFQVQVQLQQSGQSLKMRLQPSRANLQALIQRQDIHIKNLHPAAIHKTDTNLVVALNQKVQLRQQDHQQTPLIELASLQTTPLPVQGHLATEAQSLQILRHTRSPNQIQTTAIAGLQELTITRLTPGQQGRQHKIIIVRPGPREIAILLLPEQQRATLRPQGLAQTEVILHRQGHLVAANRTHHHQDQVAVAANPILHLHDQVEVQVQGQVEEEDNNLKT